MMAMLFYFFASLAMAQNVPKVELGYWNSYDDITYRNNCYNYGTNRVTNNYAQPGEASGISGYEMECSQVLQAANADLGLMPDSHFPFTAKTDDTLIAVVVAPDYDYHWYRRGDDGMWTHKMGGTPASAKDESGNAISDVVTADRGDYTEFCGYFRMKNYVYTKHEQDGGYVRIGNMMQLPDKPTGESVVEILKYSGRRNPQYLLRELMANRELREQLTVVSEQLSVSPLALATGAQIAQFEKLGYNGILIIDREGLIFPRDSRVQIKGVKTLAHFNGATDPVSWTIREPVALEQQLQRQSQRQ